MHAHNRPTYYSYAWPAMYNNYIVIGWECVAGRSSRSVHIILLLLSCCMCINIYNYVPAASVLYSRRHVFGQPIPCGFPLYTRRAWIQQTVILLLYIYTLSGRWIINYRLASSPVTNFSVSLHEIRRIIILGFIHFFFQFSSIW